MSAAGARIEAPKAPREWGLGRGCFPPQPTRGSGERRAAPPAASGRSPRRQRILSIFCGHRTLLLEINLK